MREIKFRAWVKDRKAMLHVSSITFSEGEVAAITCAVDHRTHFLPDAYFKPEGVELMQITGLHDRNGEEIYEGDIVEYVVAERISYGGLSEDVTEIGIVVFSDGAFWIAASETGDCEMIHLGTAECTVIGDIYENPELLTD